MLFTSIMHVKFISFTLKSVDLVALNFLTDQLKAIKQKLCINKPQTDWKISLKTCKEMFLYSDHNFRKWCLILHTSIHGFPAFLLSDDDDTRDSG